MPNLNKFSSIFTSSAISLLSTVVTTTSLLLLLLLLLLSQQQQEEQQQHGKTSFSSFFVEAWSPSKTPDFFSEGVPAGVKFKPSPQKTQCCFMASNVPYCVTNGDREARPEILQMNNTEIDVENSATLDPANEFKLSSCAFAVYKNSVAYLGFVKDYESQNPSDSVIIKFDVSSMTTIGSGVSYTGCNLDAPTTGAVATDTGYVLASGRMDGGGGGGGGGGSSGLLRLTEMTQPGPGPSTTVGQCSSVSLLQTQEGEEEPGEEPSVYAGLVDSGADSNITFWVTSKGLFKYDVDKQTSLSNITDINTTQQALMSMVTGTPGVLVVYTARMPDPGPGPMQYFIYKINLGTFAIAVQYTIMKELCGFMYASSTPDAIVAATRKPDFGIVKVAYTNPAGPATTGLACLSADGGPDDGAILPSGSGYFQQGELPTVFGGVGSVGGNWYAYLFATPKLQGSQNLLLPTLAIQFDITANVRQAHHVMKAGATTVSSSIVAGSSYVVVLASTPGIIARFNADNLDEVEDEIQLNILESTASTADSITAFDSTKGHLYVSGMTMSTNKEPTWIYKYDVNAAEFSELDVIELTAGKLFGTLTIKTSTNTLYLSGETTEANTIYIERFNISGTTISTQQTIVLVGFGNKVMSSTLDPSEKFLLLATDTKALVRVSIDPVFSNTTATVISDEENAQTLSADPYGFVTIGYSNPGAIEVVHPASGQPLVPRQTINFGQGGGGGGGGQSNNVNLVRRTDDDNVIGLSISEQQQGPNTILQTSLYTMPFDMISEPDTNLLSFGSATTINGLGGPVAAASQNGFTFAMGREKDEVVIGIFRSGSKTSYLQGRTLYAQAKRSLLFVPQNSVPMTWSNAVAWCKSQPVPPGEPDPVLVALNDPTELDAVRGLFDQDAVWVAGTYNTGTMKWSWPAETPDELIEPGAPCDGGALCGSWWAAEFPFQSDTDQCAYVRQGRLFNGNCELKFLPVCRRPYLAVDRNLVNNSIPTSPWLNMGSLDRVKSATVGSVFGLRRVDFEDNFFTCINRPWTTEVDFKCGAAWDTNIYGPPWDVQMTSYDTMLVATETSLYEVNIRLARQYLVRQYTTFRRRMTQIQQWNLTIVYGETRTDFYVTYGDQTRVNIVTLRNNDACDLVQFVGSKGVLCFQQEKVVRYVYFQDPKTLVIRLVAAKSILEAQVTQQSSPTNFALYHPTTGELSTTNAGILKMSIFNDLVTQNIGYNTSASAATSPPYLCQLVGRNSPGATKAATSFRSYTAITEVVPENPMTQTCGYGYYKNCTKTRVPVNRRAINLNCSVGTNSGKPPPTSSKQLSWINVLLANAGLRNGQVSLSFANNYNKPEGAPTQTIEISGGGLEGDVVSFALTVLNFPCISRSSDLSSYCLSTIQTCDPFDFDDEGGTKVCYETHAFGAVTFDAMCDVARYCNITILSGFNIWAPTLDAILLNVATFAGELDSQLQFNLTGVEKQYLKAYDNRVAVFQNPSNYSQVTLDRSTSWLSSGGNDDPPESWYLIHPTVATETNFATGAALLTSSQAQFWKRSTTIVTAPNRPPIHYAVVIYTEQGAEYDNVLKCGSTVTGLLRFAPYVSNPEDEMPPIVVDSVAPLAVGVVKGEFQNDDNFTWSGSKLLVGSGEFTLGVNCTTTQSVQLFLTFNSGAITSVPFYVIGEDVVGAAGAPPQVQTYPPVPPDPKTWNTSTGFTSPITQLKDATSIADISSVIDLLPQTPSSIVVFCMPFAGSFVLSDSCPKALGNVSFGKVGDASSAKIALAQPGNDTFAKIMKECVGFFPAPAMIYRGGSVLTSNMLAAQVMYPGATGGLVGLPIDALNRDNGPELLLNDTCNVTITVGHEKYAWFGQVFKHPIGKNMEIKSKITYRASYPTQLVTIKCNASGFCSVFFDVLASTTNFELTASDGFFYRSVNCGVYGEFVSLRENIRPATFAWHALSTFTYAIPSTLFISSSTYDITGVLEHKDSTNFPLESGMVFQTPSTITGKMKEAKLYNLTVFASSPFGSATTWILFNSTNYPPVWAANQTINLRALVAFSEKITLNSLFSDADSDSLQFTVLNTGNLPSWLKQAISPGTMTTSPQEMTLTGTSTADFEGMNETITISCADSWSSSLSYINLLFRREYLRAVNRSGLPPVNFSIHPGVTFLIPFNLSEFFVSTAGFDFSLEVTLASDKPITDLSFTTPATGSSMGAITGKLENSAGSSTLEVGDALLVRNVTVTARDPFETTGAVAFIFIHPVNNPPNLTVAAWNRSRPIFLGSFNADHKMTLTVPVSNFFFDPDGDELNYDVSFANGAWLSTLFTFAPGMYTTAAQTLTIDGTVPVSAADTNITMTLLCTDRWQTTSLRFSIMIPASEPPILVKPLPNFTIAPTKTISGTILISEYFVSTAGDKIEALVQTPDGGSWITTTLTGDVGKQTLKITAAPTLVEDATGYVLVEAKNPFGQKTPSKIFVHAVRTTWQQIESTLTLASTVAGLVLTVVGFIAYWPTVFSIIKGKRVVIPCPLSRENPMWHFPEDCEEVKVMIRDDKWYFVALFKWWSHFMWNLYTLKLPPRVGPPMYLKVFDKHIGLRIENLDSADPNDPPWDCICQFYDGDSVILKEFDCTFKELYGDGPGRATATLSAGAQAAALKEGFGGGSSPSSPEGSGAYSKEQPLIPNEYHNTSSSAIEMTSIQQQQQYQQPSATSAAGTGAGLQYQSQPQALSTTNTPTNKPLLVVPVRKDSVTKDARSEYDIDGDL